MKRSTVRPLLGVGVGMSLVAMGLACGAKPAGQQGGSGQVIESTGGTGEAFEPDAPSALQKRLAAMEPAQALPPSDAHKQLVQKIDRYFAAGSQRLYVHLDKPLYQPGETMWFRIWQLATPTTTKALPQTGVTAELVSPKGAVVLSKRILSDQDALATNDFELPPEVQGGEYTLRISNDLGDTMERSVIVSSYQPPRIKKKLEFTRKAYGEGDTVAAALSLNRATGEALGRHQATAIVTLDEAEVARVPVTTDERGNVIVKFELPGQIARGDGLLTVLVADGGVTESIQKRIPITMTELRFDMYAEGGDLVSGLPGRVYFMAKNLIDEPADVEGRVVDGAGREITKFRSLHDGLGRFELLPGAGVEYFAEITKPRGISQKIPLPARRAEGCTMQAIDDPMSGASDLRVAVWCTGSQTVVTTAVMRDKRLADAEVEVAAGAPTVVAFPMPPGAQGAVRVTVFDEQVTPMAERLIYRGRGNDLKVTVKPEKESYTPRERVTLTVETADLRGKPVEADLSLAVVDDTVLSFADDHTANLLARLYLEAEMPGQEIEKPNFYLSKEVKAAHAIDLVMGTHGWRRFDWQRIEAPPVTSTGYGFEDDVVEGEMVPMAAPEEPADMAPRAARPAPRKPAVAQKKDRARAEAKPLEEKRAERQRGPARDRNMVVGGEVGGAPVGAAGGAMMDADWAGEDEIAQNQWAWAPVRQFSVPSYEGRYDGPRTDFRETIYWAPSVKTDGDGKARVSFYLSDAITSFRVTAEGVSAGGLPGRGEALVRSKLPVSLDVKMPLEVSAGDTVELPVTLSNETAEAYEVEVSSSFGAAFKVKGGVPDKVKLKAGERRSFFAELEVVGDGKNPEDGKVTIGIDAGNLTDTIDRTVRVVPLGFPQELSVAGTLSGRAVHEIELAGALPGTINATITMYPSPLATMIQGTEAIIREPYGCFEQASSANYPNVMVLGYLEENQAADPALVERTMGMLDSGYQKLTGYESPTKGYEWFGGDPGHEALTAYGLMEFVDMQKVYGDVDPAMVDRTRKWLLSRRDGKGGYQRNARALDSFGRASEEVTNGYVTWALTEAGTTGIDAEIAYQKKIASSTRDPYLMALAANTLVNADPTGAATTKALDALGTMQKDGGVFSGADHSITRSGGEALDIETTALAAMAFIDAGKANTPIVRDAIAWLNDHRSGYGNFASTQATILALRAMTTYAEASRVTESSGVARVLVNGKQVGEQRFDKGHQGALVFDDVAAALERGKNTIELRLDSDAELPYSIAIDYRSKMPASSEHTAVALSTSLAKSEVPMGEGVRMKVKVENKTAEGIPMTLARVGVPGGLAFQTWQLDELRKKGLIDFYETRQREVVLYFRSMKPEAVVDLDLDLLAQVPGEYVAPASSAYLYYTDEYKDWVEPARVRVTRERGRDTGARWR